MATKFLTNIDLQQNQLKAPVIDVKTSAQVDAIDPAIEGQLVYDSSAHKLRVYNGTSWKDASITSTSFTINGTSISLGDTKTITADASTLTGITLNSSVTSSSLTSVGTLSSLSTTGDVTVGGDLNVTGAINETTVNNLNIKDLTIVLSQGAANKTASNNAGVTVDLGTDGTAKLYYTSADDRFNFSKNLNATVYGTAANLTNIPTGQLSGQVPLANGGTNADASTTSGKATARQNLGATGYYSSASHSSGTTISIAQSTHLLNASGIFVVQVFEVVTGDVVYPDININTSTGEVTITFAVSQSANSHRVTIIGQS